MSDNKKMALIEQIRSAANLEEAQWNADRIMAIKNMVAPDAKSHHELAMFLGTCNKYDLDPLQNEAWLGQMNGRPAVIVGRDGYMKIANRDPNFIGVNADVVREGDDYAVERRGSAVAITHKKNGFNRGKIMGSYALLRREGKDDIFYEQPWDELKHLHSRGTWQKHPSQMILTRAVLFVLKLGYSLSGVYSAGDVFTEEDAIEGASKLAEDATRARLDSIKERLGGDEVQDAEFEVEEPKMPETDPDEYEGGDPERDEQKAQFLKLWKDTKELVEADDLDMPSRTDWQEEVVGKRNMAHWDDSDFEKAMHALRAGDGVYGVSVVNPEEAATAADGGGDLFAGS